MAAVAVVVVVVVVVVVPVEGSNPGPGLQLQHLAGHAASWAGSEPCTILQQIQTVFGSRAHIGRIHDSRNCSSDF